MLWGGWLCINRAEFSGVVWSVLIRSGSSFAGGGEWGWGWLFFLLWCGGLCILGVRFVEVFNFGCVIDSWGRGVGPRVWIIGVLVILIEWCGV